MNTTTLFIAVLSAALTAEQPAPRAAKKRAGPTPTPVTLAAQRTESCGASFLLPAQWKAEPITPLEAGECKVGLLPPDWSAYVSQSEVENGSHPITILVSSRGLKLVASSAAFTNRQGEWFVSDRGGETPASPVSREGWQGFLGEPTVGWYFKSGPYAGLGETQRALLIAPDGRCAVLNGTAYEPVFLPVLQSFRFVSSSPPR